MMKSSIISYSIIPTTFYCIIGDLAQTKYAANVDQRPLLAFKLFGDALSSKEVLQCTQSSRSVRCGLRPEQYFSHPENGMDQVIHNHTEGTSKMAEHRYCGEDKEEIIIDF